MTRRYPTAAAELAAYLRNSPDTGIGDASGLNVGAPVEATGTGTPTEHQEQVALFEWAALAQGAHPELAMLFAVPNGGARHPAVAAQLKAEGVRAGVPDVFLAVPRGRHHGLFIEMKRKPNKPRQEQRDWLDRLRYYGYSTCVCYGAQDAINTIMAYLEQEGA